MRPIAPRYPTHKVDLVLWLLLAVLLVRADAKPSWTYDPSDCLHGHSSPTSTEYTCVARQTNEGEDFTVTPPDNFKGKLLVIFDGKKRCNTCNINPTDYGQISGMFESVRLVEAKLVVKFLDIKRDGRTDKEKDRQTERDR